MGVCLFVSEEEEGRERNGEREGVMTLPRLKSCTVIEERRRRRRKKLFTGEKIDQKERKKRDNVRERTKKNEKRRDFV